MICLIHPSRGRAKKAIETFNRWYDNANRPFTLHHYLSIDSDDSEILEYCAYNGSPIVGPNKSVVEATNRAATIIDHETYGWGNDRIYVYLSDDFDCPKYWDKLIEAEFEGVTEPMMLKVDDCLQRFEVGVLTIPIMNRVLYEKLGYFWHPDYKSMHVDVDLFETCKKLGVIKYAPHLKFPHNHYSNGKAPKDDTYTRSEGNWDQGLQVLKRRRAQGFPI